MHKDIFLHQKGQLLGHHGYVPDPDSVEQTTSSFVFYHLTYKERLDKVLEEGLFARIPSLANDLTPEFEGCHMVEGFLSPLPFWLSESPYFGNLGYKMVRNALGNVLLRVEVPKAWNSLYISDWAHQMECKYYREKGTAPLNLGYDCRTGHNSVRAYANSFVKAEAYQGGHVAPIAHVLRRGQGIAVPSEHIQVASVQPLQE